MMEAIAPSESAVTVLRAIAQAGFAYTPTKGRCKAAGWPLVDDEPDLGSVSFEMRLAADSSEWRELSVILPEASHQPMAFVPLFAFEEDEEDREPFDQAFRSISDRLAEFLGAPAQSGVYRYPHRPEWSYSFAGWELADATLVLVQDEFDIQFGMDVTLWVQPAGTPIEAPVRCE